jgi:hypothetical protein
VQYGKETSVPISVLIFTRRQPGRLRFPCIAFISIWVIESNTRFADNAPASRKSRTERLSLIGMSQEGRDGKSAGMRMIHFGGAGKGRDTFSTRQRYTGMPDIGDRFRPLPD